MFKPWKKSKASAPKKPVVTLADLPTWDVQGSKLDAKQIPSCVPKYAPNTEINKKISFWMGGDSTKLKCDAIVNAANSYLAAGGGICGAIFSAAGYEELQKACDEQGYTETGGAKMTPGFRLPSKYVIHAVGPVGVHPEALRSAYNLTLGFMDNDKVKSIAFCCISTGIYGYSIEKATPVALDTVRKWLEVPENLAKTDRLVFVVFMPKDQQVYSHFAHVYFPLEGVEYKKSTKEEETEEEEKQKEEDVVITKKHHESKEHHSEEEKEEPVAKEEAEKSAEDKKKEIPEVKEEKPAEEKKEENAEAKEEKQAEDKKE
ncbi:Appr-1-p processing enzyme family protein [Trichomonas vaginalis G3]|uniref:Appr-1-p processing enzyme family protein n=1 Tax=Trichomonas vaginalis (strain ATCC PRA-98 / G3) TaxID=412133 RepID=A2DTG7_TRIV3|nr:ADP-D-ribose binding [Trichomonas vaginalis G3]EAY16276.1 Appr-1-p processing enzyme family protein [Trichomonas vaginalis G3]KAI5523426.1 ADP-D-ribose binding [Trichomonas vaginalis G3]|eukprot:XP_001328499.1 Appr-1-p processing enzyme family protein [Trichomonas vaginalis G3]